MKTLMKPKMITLLRWFLLTSLVSTSSSASAAPAEAGPGNSTQTLAMELLKASDESRGAVTEGLAWKSQIETSDDGDISQREFTIKAKGHDAYVEATSPARNKGEVYIFNERNMWFYKPTLKKPVSISSRQKLSGQAANGDIASTHYARDYTANIEKTETLNGEKYYVLMLKAKADNLTYDQIRYWISDKTKLAVKAEFLNLQGQPFKLGEMQYNNFVQIGTRKIPFVSRLVITDAKYPQNKSTIDYKTPSLEKIADSIFNVGNLSR